MSDANITYLAYALENAWGVAPAPTNLQKIRFTKTDLMHDKMVVKSATIRDDRQTDESAQVGVEAKGSFDAELVVGDLDPFFQSAFFDTFANVGAVPTLYNGVTRQSFQMETKFTAASFMSYAGMQVDQCTLTMTSRQIVTVQFTFLGKLGAVAGATIDSGGSVADVGTGLILTASTNVANLTVGGVAMGSAKTLTLTINNNVRNNDVIASVSPTDQGIGSFAVTGKMDAYFRDTTLLTAFTTHADSAIVFEVSRAAPGAVTGDLIGYRFTVPKLKFTKAIPPITGKDTDVMIPLEFDAQALPGVQATGTLTFGVQAADTETVTIGGKVYTFQAALTNINGNVKIGVDAATSRANLIKAINLTGVPGTDYAVLMTQHPTVTAAQGAGNTLVVTAVNAGTAGNAIATTETLAGALNAWGAATLAGGTRSYTCKIEKLLAP